MRGQGGGGVESDDHLVAASPTKKRLRVRTKASSSSPRPKKKKSFFLATSRERSDKKKKSQSWCRGWRRAAEKAERVLRFRYEETVTGLREPFRL